MPKEFDNKFNMKESRWPQLGFAQEGYIEELTRFSFLYWIFMFQILHFQKILEGQCLYRIRLTAPLYILLGLCLIQTVKCLITGLKKFAFSPLIKDRGCDEKGRIYKNSWFYFIYYHYQESEVWPCFPEHWPLCFYLLMNSSCPVW